MCFGYGAFLEEIRDEGGGEAVAGADGVGYLNFGRWLEGYVAGGKDVAAVDTAGEYEHLQIVFSEQYPAFILKIDTGITEHTADSHEFLVVYLQDVASLHRVAEYFFVVESLTEIDVEDNESVIVIRHGVEEAVNCVA